MNTRWYGDGWNETSNNTWNSHPRADVWKDEPTTSHRSRGRRGRSEADRWADRSIAAPSSNQQKHWTRRTTSSHGASVNLDAASSGQRSGSSAAHVVVDCGISCGDSDSEFEQDHGVTSIDIDDVLEWESAGSIDLEDALEWEELGMRDRQEASNQCAESSASDTSNFSTSRDKSQLGGAKEWDEEQNLGGRLDRSRVGPPESSLALGLQLLGMRDGSEEEEEEEEENWEAICREALQHVYREERRPAPTTTTSQTPALAQTLEDSEESVGEGLRACREKPLVPAICVRCGTEILVDPEASDQFGILLHCGTVGKQCSEINVDDGRHVYIHCCAACGEARVLGVDLVAVGFDFTCRLAGYSCNAAARDATESLGQLQTCCICGAEHSVQLDLGVDFQCGHLGLLCWRAAQEQPTDHDGSGDEATALSLTEQQQLLAKFGRVSHRRQPRLGREELKCSLQLQTQDPRERYRDNTVVSTRGERFITVGSKAAPGPGSELGGIIGSSSRGRLGLGLKKMSKEDAEKYGLSNKERGHLKKRVAHAKNERETVVFETKKNIHQFAHSAVLPTSVVR